MRREAPRAAAWLMRFVAGGHAHAEPLLADLEEELLRHQIPARGPRAARSWYWRQTWSALPHLARRRWERRRARGWTADGVHGDLRYAVRTLSRNRLYAGTAILTLALGIGANTALFSVLRGVVLAPLPYERPQEIHRAWAHADDGDVVDFSFRVAEYLELHGGPGSLLAVGGEFPTSGSVHVPGADPVQVDARMVTPGFFEVFGVSPALGRLFDAEEIEGGDALLALVSDRLWRTVLGGDPGAVGATLELDGLPFIVVGVLPASYRHVSDPGVDVFIPYTIGTSRWVGRWLELYVRVPPGVGADGAAREITAAMARVGERESRSARWHATAERLDAMVLGDAGRMVWVLFASVGILLLVACVNVAGLSLARSVDRLGEMRLRRALGAGRGRLARQMILESLVLAALGGVAGLGVGSLGLDALVALAPAEVPRLDEVGLDPVVLLFTAGATLGAGLLFGLAPALRAGRAGPTSSLAGAARGGVATRRTQTLLGGLVIAEVALALVLLVGAGLLVRTVRALEEREMGFEPAGALTFRMSLPAARYPSEEVPEVYARYLAGLAAIPGVEAVGAGTDLPLGGRGAVAGLVSEERVLAGPTDPVAALQRRATPGFFHALGTPLLAGRTFLPEEDAARARVLVLSESLARTLFGGATQAVGRRVAFGSAPEPDDWMTVVGVVGDVQYVGPDASGDLQLYQAHRQSAAREMAIVVRGSGEPIRHLDAARTLLREMDPTIPIFAVSSLDEAVRRSTARPSFAMTLFSLFAGIATVLAAAGVYGVLAFAVSRRRREIGVRMALGADAGSVVASVVRRGALLALAGVVPGLLAAWGLQRGMEGLLFGVEGLDPPVMAVTAAIALAVAAAAAWLPARRAARVDPSAALREE